MVVVSGTGPTLSTDFAMETSGMVIKADITGRRAVQSIVDTAFHSNWDLQVDANGRSFSFRSLRSIISCCGLEPAFDQGDVHGGIEIFSSLDDFSVDYPVNEEIAVVVISPIQCQRFSLNLSHDVILLRYQSLHL